VGALPTGTRFGPYEILGLVGEGGMGAVYRARDTRLNREVAVKVLPATVSQDASRRERFEHEARVVAALNHPNILALYDVGTENGISYIVTELLEGTSLRNADLPIRKIVDVAAQIADGLASAHAVGVVHRDLKPENVILTPDGRAKILDFGLAKVASFATVPTMVETQPGVVMGTVGYMSPEQVRAVEADHRSDIFSFGAILYELLAGKRAFAGETAADVMTAILRHDAPDLPESIPAILRMIVRRCLEKQPDERFQSARDLAFALRQLSTAGTSSEAARVVASAAKTRSRWWDVAAAAMAGVALGGVATLLWGASGDNATDPIQLTRITSEPATEFNPAFSPDGKAIAYNRIIDAEAEIMVRSLEASRPVAVARGTGIVGRPFWHPDGTRVCYTVRRETWCVSAAGGTPQKLSTGSAVFTPDGQSLLIVNYEGGVPRLAVSSPPGADPQPLEGVVLPETASALRVSPDGSKLLVSSQDGLWLFRYPSGGSRKVSTSDSATVGSASWFPDSRHLLLSERTNNLRAYQVIIIDSESGARRLVRHDSDAIVSSTLSPDGKRIVFSRGAPEWDILEFSLNGKRLRPVVTTGDLDTVPSWSPAGDRFAHFMSGSGTQASIWTRNADGSGESLLVSNLSLPTPPRYSPDGNRIAYADGRDLYTIPATGGGAVRIVSAEFYITRLCWSPDGEWLWYQQGASVWKVPSQGGQTTVVSREGAALADCSPSGEILMGIFGSGARLIGQNGEFVRALSTGPLSQGGRAPSFGEGGKVLYALGGNRRSIDVLDATTGAVKRSIEFELNSTDLIDSFSVHPNGTRVLLQVGGLRYDLWLAEGFAQPMTGWRRWFRHWDVPSPPTGDADPQFSNVTD
jgi:eukaryotic-like serine/threonine-protein kinase